MSERDKSAPPVRIAMLGAGTVGSSVAKLLARHQHDLAHRVGAGFELVAVGVKDINKPRVGIAQSLLNPRFRIGGFVRGGHSDRSNGWD